MLNSEIFFIVWKKQQKLVSEHVYMYIFSLKERKIHSIDFFKISYLNLQWIRCLFET